MTKKEILKTIDHYSADKLPYQDNLVIKKGRGSYYWDDDGTKYLDFTSGIFTNSFGHCYWPLVLNGLRQSLKMNNIHGRKSNTEADFYKKLAAFMPQNDYKFISYNDGGYAVDRALTDLINHFKKKRIPIAAFKGGFHGKTMATKLLVNETEKATFFENLQVEYPYCYRCPFKKQPNTCQLECAQHVCHFLKEKQVKVLIFEPVQGSKVVIPPKKFWSEVEAFCKKNNILMFADEVLTGVGRTGHFLASYGHYHLTPDVITLTKGLGNGMPLSVICERDFITQNTRSQRMWEHSSTFAKNPYSLGIATKVLDLLVKKDIFKHVQEMSVIFKQELEKFRNFKYVGDVRSIGLMGGIEFVKNKTTKEENTEFGQQVFLKARSKGLEVIPGGHMIRLAPPLNIKKKDLILGMHKLFETIKELEAENQ